MRYDILCFVHLGLWWRFVNFEFHNCLAFFVRLFRRLKWRLISRSACSQSSNSWPGWRPRASKSWFVRQAPDDTAHYIRDIFKGFGLLFGWIRFHIDFNSLPIPAFREGDCSAFANNLASSDILPPPIIASVNTTSVYRIASCGSRPARRF